MSNSRVCALNHWTIPPFRRADLRRKTKCFPISSCPSPLRSEYTIDDFNTPPKIYSTPFSYDTSTVFTGQLPLPPSLNQSTACFLCSWTQGTDTAGGVHNTWAIDVLTVMLPWSTEPSTASHPYVSGMSYSTLYMALFDFTLLKSISYPGHSGDNPGPYFPKH